MYNYINKDIVIARF